MKQTYLLALCALLFFAGAAFAAAPSRSYTLAICTPTNEMDSGEPIVVLSSGEIYHLTWVDAHLPEPDGVREYPVSDLKDVQVGDLGHLVKQVASPVRTTLLPIKGQLTVLSRDRNMQPTETAYELLGMEVKTVLTYADEGGVRRKLEAKIPVGSHEVEWTFSMDGGSGGSGFGKFNTHCEMRKSFVR